MRWSEKDGIRWLEVRLPGSKAVFSTRSGGSAKENHVPLATALGIPANRVATSRQVHGAELMFHDVATPDAVDADGHVIAEPGLVGLVYVADCLPLALAGPGGVAMLHCGWRGLAAGIVARGAEAVEATHAAIGPGIGPCCYEVGDEVLDAFGELGPGVATDRMLDLPQVARRLLWESGVEEIESADLCTCCEEELFFSHRRDAGPGRQAGLAWLEGAGTGAV
ncbi:MAG TPA: polyphenol oxidase family protein [Solirubrobacterales bacterium]|nr:polyphenol oxidase family protein [Solirubrobacterales bacterium]